MHYMSGGMRDRSLQQHLSVCFRTEANQLAQCLRNFEALQVRVAQLGEDVSKQDNNSVYKQLAQQEHTLAQQVRQKAVSHFTIKYTATHRYMTCCGLPK